MIFFRFIRACKKYRFSYGLSSVSELILILRPYDNFNNIKISQGYYNWNYRKLFLSAIKEMKNYRKERGI